MTEVKKDRLAHAKAAAEALRAALPGPPPKRTEKMLIAFSPEEKARLLTHAKETGEPPATAARNLIMAALTTLGK
jgi:hypothetical protein